MQETDREIWDAIDQAVFGTNDKTVIRKTIENELKEWQELESTLGGFLFLLRERKGLTVPQIASKAKVSVEVWEMWEGEVAVPTGTEVKRLVKNLGLYKTTADQVLKLWHQTPFQSLCRTVAFRPQLLAARGVAAVEAKSQWALLHQEAQVKLASWGEKQGFALPEQLFELLSELDFETEDELKEWAREVWNACD